MAQDRTYEMGCNCPKKLTWCDGECEEKENVIEQIKQEEEKAQTTDLNMMIVIMVIMCLSLAFC